MERFDWYETQLNSNREELKELAQEVAALRGENNTLRRFCSDRLLNIYETLGTRDVETTEALRTILTLHHEEHRLNQRHREVTTRLEALLGQPLSKALNQADAVLPPLAIPPPSPPAGTESGRLSADIPMSIQASNKRGTSSRPEDTDTSAKRQKL